MSRELRVIPVEGMPEVREGDRVGELIAERVELQEGDVVVISQKIVSKAEGRVVRLDSVTPSARARELAERLGKEPELVEL
ncbi:MAG TPA: coenzyme F420-0:L-glutamate ligase, partial [Solirubrobacterales bacterium]